MKFKKISFSVLATVLSLALFVFYGASSPAHAANDILIRLAFENSLREPVGQALQRWKDLLDEKNGGVKLELFPDSQLGSKSEIIDSMLLGERVITLADGAFYADYGVPDFGIVFGPFLFNNWEECWTLTKSDWYAEQCALLEKKGLKIISSNWAYGIRHTLTVSPVRTVDDLKGMKIRVPGNQIQAVGFDTLGAAATGMPLGEVYQALQTGAIDGAENPLSTLHGRKLHEVAKYLILNGHVMNFTTWVMSTDVFNSLTPEQQRLLVDTCYEAGVYNNQLAAEADGAFLKLMTDEGVTVVHPSEEVLNGFREKAREFYTKGSLFGWSDGLYEKVTQAMGRK